MPVLFACRGCERDAAAREVARALDRRGLGEAYLAGAGMYVVKLAGGGLVLAVFETAIAKMRVFRVPDFLGAALMLGFLAALLLFVSQVK